MEVFINGEAREVPEGTTIADLVKQAGLDRSACAAEVNQTLIPRRDHDRTTLTPGDRIELVTLVGGG